MIAVESWDRGRTLTDAVESRRTLARGPVIVCESSNGFSVGFARTTRWIEIRARGSDGELVR